MLLQRLLPDSDLGESSLEAALKLCYEKGGQRTLVVCCQDTTVGAGLARKYGLKLLLETDLPQNAWYVHDKWGGVFSCGP